MQQTGFFLFYILLFPVKGYNSFPDTSIFDKRSFSLPNAIIAFFIRLPKSQYYDYTITLVEEIEQPSKPLVYIVHMEDATTLKNIRVSERDMEVIEDCKKA